MTKLSHYDHTGKKLTDLTVNEAIFAVKISPALLAQAASMYQDRLHQHTHKVKTRGEVALTTAKWFRQKGTGRARHGAKSAHIFVGGGVAHGPTGARPAVRTLPVKMRRLSIIGALSNRANDQVISIVSGLDQIKAKTSDVSKLLQTIKSPNKSVLLLIGKTHPNLLKASSNLHSLTTVNYQQTNTLQLLRARQILIDQDALSLLETWLLPKKTSSNIVTKTVTSKTKTTKTIKAKTARLPKLPKSN